MGRHAIVNAAMEALARNIPNAYARNKITNGEAAAWLNNNRYKLYIYTPSWRQFLIDGLNEEIEDVTKNVVKATTSVEKMKEIIKILSEQAPAAAPASEQEPNDAIKLTKLIDKLTENDVARNKKAKHHLSFLSSSSSDPEKKRNEAKELTELMKSMINHENTPDYLKAMYHISTLRGNEGGYRRRTKYSKKHRKSKKSRKSRMSRKCRIH